MKKILFIVLALALSACAAPPAAAPATQAPSAAAAPQALNVMTHDSFAVSESVLKQFEADNNVKVTVLKSGDAGSMLNKAILTRDAPLADALFGIDNTFMSRALNAGIFEPYASPALASIPDRFKLDKANRLLPVDYGHVVINYDKAFLQGKGLTPPAALRELTNPNGRACSLSRTRPRHRPASPFCWRPSPLSPKAAITPGNNSGQICAPTTCTSAPTGTMPITHNSAAAAVKARARWW